MPERMRHQDATVRIVAVKNLLVAAWSDAPALEHMRVLDREVQALHRQHDRTGYVNLVLGGVPNFTAEVRAEAERLTKQNDTFGLGTAHIIVATGLAGSASRMFLSTITLITRPRTPTKVFAAIEPAATWLSDRLAPGPQPWTAAEIHELLASLQTAG